MDFHTFKSIVEKTKTEHTVLFALEHDAVPDMKDVLDFQQKYRIWLPEKYIQFLTNYGGGYFGYANIYSLDPDSYFYLGKHNKTVLDKLLFFADNECGDSYAFRIEDGKCDDAVAFYDHEKKKICDTEFCDIFEYLIKTGLNLQP